MLEEKCMLAKWEANKGEESFQTEEAACAKGSEGKNHD